MRDGGRNLFPAEDREGKEKSRSQDYHTTGNSNSSDGPLCRLSLTLCVSRDGGDVVVLLSLTEAQVYFDSDIAAI